MGDITKNLSYHEYLPRREYDLLSKGKLPNRALQLMVNPSLIKADQAFIDRYGSTIINNWKAGGQYEFSAFRPADYKEGAMYSDHRFGMASDKKPLKVTLDEIFKDLSKNPDMFYNLGYRTIETPSLTPTWFHGSVASYLGQRKVIIVGG